MPAKDLPLAGVRVLDFTRVLAGPFCTALLADLGADVIKIEPPQGDDYRAVAPMRDGHGALFSVVNRNKQSAVLDLKQAEGVALARELASHADIVIENFRPGVADKLGIGYAALSAVNERLIYVSVSGFGQSGPAAHRPAYDIVIQAMSGLMAATGSPDGPPTLIGEAVSDVVAGLFASWGALVALFARERHGRGTHVDVSMLDSTLAFAATSVSRHLFTGAVPARVGNRHPLSAPFGVFRARDGHFVLAVLNNKLFAALAAAIDRPDLCHDPRNACDETRAANEAALREAIEAWSMARDVADVERALEAAAVPVAPIWNIAQALACEQSQARGVLTEVAHPALPGLRLPSQPLKFSAFEGNVVKPAPALGEHTDAVLQRVLGLSMARVAELRAAGAFGAV
ncbi:CaiB/BaiF CoA transferase family protein [Pandoraea terrae]|uniref:CaiB/BaiF CoA transferase family protein n=1 Tax=Pandoraea terrae TaxID=1537710 RepID=UPI001CD6B364|nr:CoA transferase [Pandoraea terrae]